MSITNIPENFRLVDTPWGEKLLHTSNKVWIVHYPLAIRPKSDAFVVNKKLQYRGVWTAYYGRYSSEKPWCEHNWQIGEFRDMEGAVNACIKHLEKNN